MASESVLCFMQSKGWAMKYRELTPEEIEIYNLGYRVGNHQTVITDIEWNEEEKTIYRKGYLAGAKAFARTGKPTPAIMSTMSTMSTPRTPNTVIYDNYNKQDSNKGGVGEKEKGSTPTLEEVLEYAAQQNQMAGVGGFKCTPETAERFWTHYESINWRMGNEARTPITNWKAKLRHWSIKDALGEPPPRETEKERKARENHEKLEELIRKSKEAQEKDKK